jgi:transposase
MDNISNVIDKILGLPEPWYVTEVKFDHPNKTVHITIEFKRGSQFPCSICGGNWPVHDTLERSWRHLDLFDYKTMIHAKLPRTECKTHGVRVIELKLAEKGSSFTAQFETLVLSFAKEMSVAAVAVLVRIHEDSVWRILERYVMREVEKIDLSGLKIVGIDEFAYKSDYEFMTIFGDLAGDGAKVVFIAEGKDATVIQKFRERLGDKIDEQTLKRMIFCVDMSKSYRKGLEENFPGSRLIFDRFHIMKNVNVAVDDIRREESFFNRSLVGTRYLWLKNFENLSDEEKKILKGITEMDSKTAKAYQMKIALRRFWDFNNVKDAVHYLKDWCRWAARSKLFQMQRIGKMIKSHWNGIVNSFRYGLSNGPMEGLVNKIKTAIKRAYGFKTTRNLSTIVYLIASDIKLPTRN